tara:strand:- start:186 stop:482 length:297 start_codon:yes stop_codon:yes gene_type:complete
MEIYLMSDTYKCDCGHIVHTDSKNPPESLNWNDGHTCILVKEKKMSEIKLYDVLISYPIQVGAESEEHVKEIIMANELLRNAADLTLEITEIKEEKPE